MAAKANVCLSCSSAHSVESCLPNALHFEMSRQVNNFCQAQIKLFFRSVYLSPFMDRQMVVVHVITKCIIVYFEMCEGGRLYVKALAFL